MVRIAEEEIERLKREISVERLVEARGVKLVRHGADLIGLCPFHEDHSPSLVISPQKNLWNCLGACRRGGDVIEWVMRAEGVSFRHAVELLRKEAPLTARPVVKESTVPKLPSLFSPTAGDRAVLGIVVSYYHETLKNSPEAQQYLIKRGLQSSEMVGQFRLGYSNRTLSYHLPDKNRKQGEEQRGKLARLGILRESGHEHFNGSVVIPIFNLAGEVVEMYGRKITPGLRPGTPLHLYLPGAHRGVWNEEALVASKEISALMEAVLAMLPEEQQVQYSAMTGQSLFYMGESDLKHKVLAIVEEEGALRAAYALKLLQSEGVLTIASTGKDATTGRLVTHQYRVEGPVMIFLTTTAIDLDEELLNRCLALTVNEDRAQTQAIHRKQREAQTIEGLLARQDREEVLKVHRNAQRLLEPLFVVNPYARELTFLDSQTRTRRDHMKYLTLIRSIALLHQYQRPRRSATHRGKEVEYIEVTKEDMATANRLAHEVLGRSLDELPPQTRRLLLLIDEMVSAECERQKVERVDLRFSRKDVRAFTKWSDSQLKRHLHRLEELEYLLVHHGGRGQSLVYELVFERQEDSGKPLLPGLIEIEKLTGYGYDAKKSGLEGEKSGSSLPQVRGVSGGGAGEESPALARRNGDFRPNPGKITVPARKGNRVVGIAAAVK